MNSKPELPYTRCEENSVTLRVSSRTSPSKNKFHDARFGNRSLPKVDNLPDLPQELHGINSTETDYWIPKTWKLTTPLPYGKQDQYCVVLGKKRKGKSKKLLKGEDYKKIFWQDWTWILRRF